MVYDERGNLHCDGAKGEPRDEGYGGVHDEDYKARQGKAGDEGVYEKKQEVYIKEEIIPYQGGSCRLGSWLVGSLLTWRSCSPCRKSAVSNLGRLVFMYLRTVKLHINSNSDAQALLTFILVPHVGVLSVFGAWQIAWYLTFHLQLPGSTHPSSNPMGWPSQQQAVFAPE